MRETFLRIDSRPGEELKSDFASKQGIVVLLDELYNHLEPDEAVEVHVYREYVLIGTRKKGHGDKMIKKFVNFGFSPRKHNENSSMESRSKALMYAILDIDDGRLPEYCYKAIDGDIQALRQTTEHLIRAYDAKIRRMQAKGKSVAEIEKYITRKTTAERRLTLPDEDFMEVSEPIIIEIPRDPEFFYSDDDVVFISSLPEEEA